MASKRLALWAYLWWGISPHYRKKLQMRALGDLQTSPVWVASTGRLLCVLQVFQRIVFELRDISRNKRARNA
jgi:hypothetical protein